MARCCFVTDLHGSADRYRKLFETVRREPPDLVLLGGDLTSRMGPDVFAAIIMPALESLRSELVERYPRFVVVLGNDDSRLDEERVLDIEERGLWVYAHARRVQAAGVVVYGYGFVPPTPFANKDWEKYDVSRYVPPGGISPEDGYRSVPVDPGEIRRSTIARDLADLAGTDDLSNAILLFHGPPADTNLDRAATDGRSVDHVPLDLHVGSVAVRRFIEERQPLAALHGHIHESARITGSWHDRIGRTHLFGAAHDGPELAVVRFDTGNPGAATRHLL